MKEPIFKGACTAIITPFAGDSIDFDRLGRQLDLQVAGGTSAIVAAGTTGENATLSQREYDRLLVFSVRHIAGRMQVIAGIGGNHTAECLEKAAMAESAGADALLMCTPYYNKTTQAGLIEHFTYVADRAKLPIILYNVPSRTGIGIQAETYAALARHPNINGVKEASGDFSLIARMASECAGQLNLWSGNDDQTVPMMALGAQGVVSVAGNLVPEKLSRLCQLCLSGDFSEAAARYREIAALCRLLFLETNPIPIKAAMALRGLDSGELRLPLVPMEAAHLELLKTELARLN